MKGILLITTIKIALSNSICHVKNSPHIMSEQYGGCGKRYSPHRPNLCLRNCDAAAASFCVIALRYETSYLCTYQPTVHNNNVCTHIII
jgi:hypothetical protein